MKEKALAFISGSVWAALAATGKEIFITLVLGCIGGFAGMAGKELYNYFKRSTWLKRK